LEFRRGTHDCRLRTPMRIDSSGNLLVGKSVTTFNTEGFLYEAGAAVEITTDSNRVMRLNRTTNDGNILEFNKDGTTVGSWQSRQGVVSTLILDPRSGGMGITGGGVRLTPTDNTGTEQDARNDIGTSTYRFKDLYLSGGVYLGGTGAANKLEDYEEGTWTPTLEGAVSAGSYSVAIEDSSCKYTKVGRQVTVTGRFTFTVASAGSSYAKIGGLPFATSATNAMAGAVRTKGIGLAAGTVSLCALNPTSGSVSYFAIGQSIDNADSVLLDIAGISSTDQITVTLTYFV
jgi:hypothetical protein